VGRGQNPDGAQNWSGPWGEDCEKKQYQKIKKKMLRQKISDRKRTITGKQRTLLVTAQEREEQMRRKPELSPEES